MEQPEYFIFALFPLLFAGIWCLVMFLLSWKSGWSRMARYFMYQGVFDGENHKFQSARITGVSFNGVLEVGVNEIGLLMVPFLPFRMFHKRVLIPWDYLRAEKFKRFFFNGYRIRITEIEGVHIDIQQRLFERMAPYLPLTEEEN